MNEKKNDKEKKGYVDNGGGGNGREIREGAISVGKKNSVKKKKNNTQGMNPTQKGGGLGLRGASRVERQGTW